MPARLTYPGVYVQEIPSGVRTITGVSTSVAAFVDYFKRGVADKAVRVFSFGDFEREFGGLDTKSEASYAIRQFFLNGGTEAWVVRSVGASAAAAAVTLLDEIDGADSLVLEAGRGQRPNQGTWGNQLRVRVDPLAENRFNITVLLVELRNGQELVVDTEEFRNLTVVKGDSREASAVINDESTGSKLVHVSGTSGAKAPLATGTFSGDLSSYPTITFASPQMNVTIGADGTGTAQLASAPGSLREARSQLESAIRRARPELKAFANASVSIVENKLRILAGPTKVGFPARITFEAGGSDPAAASLGLLAGERREGRMSGDVAGLLPPASDLHLLVTIGLVGPAALDLSAAGMGNLDAARTEIEAKLRAADPAPEFAEARVVVHTHGPESRLVLLSGVPDAPVTVGDADANKDTNKLALDSGSSTKLKALVSAELAGVPNVGIGAKLKVTIGADGPFDAEFVAAATTLKAVASQLQAAVRAAHASPAFTSARVADYGTGGESRLIAWAGTAADVVTFEAGPADATTVTELRLTAACGAKVNVQAYALGAGAAIAGTAQGLGAAGTDVLPDAKALIGELNPKTGLYALEDVDLFNILCIPRAAMLAGEATTAAAAFTLTSVARDYCETRRAFLLLDTPPGRKTPDSIVQWLDGNSSLRHRNAALFYPRVLIPDPLNDFRPRSCGACGTVAGLFARIDGTRGVWKAPAGTEAVLSNVPELEDVLTDQENGALNPLAINCLRNFPVFGNVAWGARTLEGSDQAASEWKYIPVRRLALFLEESLYRGTKWVVFEPNDEPLWAQIRLNVGAFMHGLFRQGAFQGQTPRDAYFVKCDKETTTQDDVNKGIVNILVGFAPLKPAEFVVISIQQIAGQVQA